MELRKNAHEVLGLDRMDLDDTFAIHLANKAVRELAAQYAHIRLLGPTESGEFPAMTDEQIYELDRALRGVA